MKACVLRLRADRLRRFQPTIAIIRWITIPGGPPLINITGDDSFAIDRKIRGGRHRGHRRVRFRAHIRTPLPPLPPLPLPARRSCRLLGCVRARVCVCGGASSSSRGGWRRRRRRKGARNLSGDSRETGINGQLHKYNV